jgi:biopolymer transport protein ExbD
MSFAFATPRRRRRPSLTPMIDVVFLLLVFFLLAARFAPEGAIPLSAPGAGAPYEGPPRLVEVRPEGLSLNGVPLASEALLAELTRLAAGPEDAVILRARGGATLQHLVAAMELLRDAGHARLVLVE